MSSNLSALLYLITGVLFILALRGLSSPGTSRMGNIFGILGMLLAIIVTFLSIDILIKNFVLFIITFSIGGAIGSFIAYKIPMTAMPQLVAGFHSLVGLAAVLVAISAYYSPESFQLGDFQNIKIASIIEMGLGASIGAITFTGSIIAFLKLQGLMSGAPITFFGQHYINAVLGSLIIFLIVYLAFNQTEQIFWSLIVISFLIGFLIIIPIGGADMPVVISMLNSYQGCGRDRLHPENTALIITGALSVLQALLLHNVKQ